jgi:hypothetical protein
MPYQPHAAFTGLFQAFTGSPDSIGSDLTAMMAARSAGQPLLVSTASEIAYFPGHGAPAQVESFRRSTRGFIELTAVSHVPLALAYIARMRELAPHTENVERARLTGLIEHAQRVREANTEAMWRDHVAVRAFSGAEQKITDMVEYSLRVSIDYMRRALDEPHLLDFEALRANYLDADRGTLPVSMNDVMFATFCLAYIDIAYRIGNWLRDRNADWTAAMVLVSGQSGRPTAGVTWSSNNMCHLIWTSTAGALLPERVYIAPHAPGFFADSAADALVLAALEQTYRRLWCHIRASVEVSRRMFAGAQPYEFSPGAASDMPAITSVDDRAACVARLRRIMEDPQQLLSNCVADYVVDALRKNGNHPERVPVPGFSDVEFRAGR